MCHVIILFFTTVSTEVLVTTWIAQGLPRTKYCYPAGKQMSCSFTNSNPSSSSHRSHNELYFWESFTGSQLTLHLWTNIYDNINFRSVDQKSRPQFTSSKRKVSVIFLRSSIPAKFSAHLFVTRLTRMMQGCGCASGKSEFDSGQKGTFWFPQRP